MKNTQREINIKFIGKYKKQIQCLSKSEWKIRNKTLIIREDNRKIARKWIDGEEERLANINGYSPVARNRNAKTLCKNLGYLKNILYWFNDKSLTEITKDDIKRVYQGIEKGEITTLLGRVLADSSKKDYYGKMFKSGFFKFFNKHGYGQEIILRKIKEDTEVRFFEEKTFKKIVNNTKLKSHEMLFYLLFDTGIEISAILQLIAQDFTLQSDETGDSYYVVHVPNEISKKTRPKRDIFIHFEKTNELLKSYLNNLRPEDKLFNFGEKNIGNVLKDIVINNNLKVIPSLTKIQIKDFRSSAACYFLTQGWSTDEIKQRLGHKPSSTVIDKYVNYLCLNQKKKREQVQQINLKEISDKQVKTEEALRKEKIANQSLQDKMKEMDKKIELLIKASKINQYTESLSLKP
jgi:integrase